MDGNHNYSLHSSNWFRGQRRSPGLFDEL
jgi:hypothetical protein